MGYGTQVVRPWLMRGENLLILKVHIPKLNTSNLR